MEVAYRRMEEPATDGGEDRVTDPAVEQGHRSRLDAAGEPVAQHEVVAVLELADEVVDPAEVVRGVGVAHHDVPAASGVDAAAECRSVAALADAHDPGAELLGDPVRAVGAAVVGYDHLTGEAGRGDPDERALDAEADRLRLVQARNDDTHDRLGAD